MPVKKIFICEDHTIVLDGLKLLLEKHPEYEIIGHATHGEALLPMLEVLKPDILILDLNLPDTDGLTLLEKMRPKYPDLCVIILTMYNDDFLIERAKKSGANAYLPKNVTNTELLDMLEKVSLNHFYLSDSLKQDVDRKRMFRDQFVTKMKLTERETEIIRLLAIGKSSAEIADQLFLSAHTVNTHRKNIFRKLGINSTVELVHFAHDNNLL
jgi:DNA-binding NarL/FixJ family response regulator